MILARFGEVDLDSLVRGRRIPSIGFAALGCGFLGTNLPREYEIARATYGWTEDTLRDLARTSIEVSFAGPDIKERLRSKLTEWRIGSDAFDEMRR